MGSSARPEGWSEDNVGRFSGFCLEKATSCKCGCGEKTLPALGKKQSIAQAFRWFLNGNTEKIMFSDYVQGHNLIRCPPIHSISEYQHQIIIASILGDGCLIYPHKSAKSPRICWNMGNQEHAKYKAEEFKFLGAKYQEKPNPGFGEFWYCIATSCHPVLSKYYSNMFSDGKLSPTPEILSELNAVGWAWLYGDDGHTNHKDSICFLHTEGFTIEQTKMFSDAIDKFIGMKECSIHSYVGGKKKRLLHCVRIRKNGSQEFMSRIEKHMATGLEYKKLDR